MLEWLDDDAAQIEHFYPGKILTHGELEHLKRVKPTAVDTICGHWPRKVVKKIPTAELECNRLVVTNFLYDCVARLCDLALAEQDIRSPRRRGNRRKSAKQWAGETLGKVIGSLNKLDQELRVNPWYHEAKAKAGKAKHLKCPSLIRQVMQKELNQAQRYWFVVQTNPTAQIPEEYQCLRKLKSFPEVEEEWFKQCLWPQIKKRKNELLPELQRSAPHRVRFLKDCYGQFRDVSQALAHQMSKRPFALTGAGTF
jgi:hypothetical protein